jgi:hypothetical protein
VPGCHPGTRGLFAHAASNLKGVLPRMFTIQLKSTYASIEVRSGLRMRCALHVRVLEKEAGPDAETG